MCGNPNPRLRLGAGWVLIFIAQLALPIAQAHEPAQLRRTVRDPLKTCTKKTTVTPAETYLYDLLEVLARANPKVFADEFEFGSFCLVVRDDPWPGANANPVNREITFSTGMLKLLKTDAQVLGVLAHEVAHILMQHNSPLANNRPSTKHRLLENDQIYLELDARRIELDQQIQTLQQKRRTLAASGADSKTLTALESEIQSLREQYEIVFNQWIKRERELVSEEQRIGWEEDEADEVGQALLLATALDANGLLNAVENIMTQNELNACRLETQPPKRIQGAIATHPGWCWRRYNLGQLERARHAEDWDAIPPQNRSDTLYPGRLESLLADL